MTTDDTQGRRVKHGINNWREAFWLIVIVSWIGLWVYSLFGTRVVSADTFLAGAQVIIVGMMAHVVALNYSPVRIGRFP